MGNNHGVGFKWGVTATSTAFGTCVVTATDLVQNGDEYTIKDNTGTTVAWYLYDPKAEATFDYIVTGGSATVSASISKPTQGNIITVTDATNTDLAGSTWLVQNSTVKEANVDAAKVTVKAIRYPSITS